MSTHTLDELDDLLTRCEEPDDVLRTTVELLAEHPAISWAGIAFLEDGELVLGPSAGVEDDSARRQVPVSFQGDRVGELLVDGDPGFELLDGVADRIAALVLIGWDTQGERWDP